MRRLLAYALIFLSQWALAQNGEERLLPDSFTQSIKIEWRQDGRVIDIDVTNPRGKWVLKNLTFMVQDEATSTWAKKNPNGRVDPVESFRRYQDLLHTLNLELQPNKADSFHIELKPGIAATGLSLLEARGREQTQIEKLKSSIF